MSHRASRPTIFTPSEAEEHSDFRQGANYRSRKIPITTSSWLQNFFSLTLAFCGDIPTAYYDQEIAPVIGASSELNELSRHNLDEDELG